MKKFLFLLLAMMVTSLMIYADVPTSSNRPGGNKNKTTNATGNKPSKNNKKSSTNSSGKKTPANAGSQKNHDDKKVQNKKARSTNNPPVDKSTQVNTFTVNGVRFKMIPVEGGSFMMGDDNDGYKDEEPVHEVTLSRFLIGETEVTQELWTAVMGSNPSAKKYVGPQKPVVSITWNDCQVFIQRLNNLTGQEFRLPTEAEWEFAARGGVKSRHYIYSGSNNADEVAWYKGNSDDMLQDVKKKKANELGLYDMSGNAMEWCQDYYDETYYNYSPSNNPTGPSSGTQRVYRDGGYFHSMVWSVRCGNRSHDSETYKLSGLSLRLAMTKVVHGNSSTQSATATQPATRQSDYLPAGDSKTYTVGGVTFKMIKVQGGSFTMGSDSKGSNEKPEHNVTLNTFMIGETEVTQELWEAVMGSNPSYSNNRGSKKPVVSISWNDCQNFIQRLNSMTGVKFRLPTEAEWEFAARGGIKTHNYEFSGSDYADEVAWYKNNSNDELHNVKTKKPNELGIYDMSGNAMEWCYDWYGEEYYYNSPSQNPKGPTSGSERVYRDGGYFHSLPWAIRCARRDHGSDTYTHPGLTLRLAL